MAQSDDSDSDSGLAKKRGMRQSLALTVGEQLERELLAEVDSTFEEVVRKRLSNATAIRQRADNNDEQKQRYRRRLRAMRDKDPGFVLRVYTEHEIKELKTKLLSHILPVSTSSENYINRSQQILMELFLRTKRVQRH